MATTPGEKARLAASEKAKARKFERSVKAMKKAVLKAQLILLDGVDTDEQLHAAGRILSQAEYADVVEERYIARVCGYARCSNALSPESARKGRYRISLSAKKVYDLEESRHFCSSACLIASKDFGGKLPVRQDVVESCASKVSKRANSCDIAVQSSQHDHHQSSSELITTGKETRTVLKEGVQRSERSSGSQQNGARVFKEWESLISGSSQGEVSESCITEVTNETRFSDLFSVEDTASSTSKGVQESPANLKPALKKKSKSKKTVRSVAWADQDTTESHSRSASTKSKVTARSVNPSADKNIVEEKKKSPKVEEEQRPETRSSESSLDLAMAARLASAEALATALTEAASSAANGEVDGSEAVAQAGISIFSATHNANTTTLVRSQEAQVQSDTFDEDDLFAKAAEAREEMRRLKMPRNYSKLQDEKDGDVDGDLVDEFNTVANEDDDSDDPTGADGDGALDDDADADDEDYDDESGGFEGADEVGFTAPPKGFKAEVSKFGTMFMALEGWISAATVAHIYGKEPHEEDEYLCVNGREYSRHVVIGDGLSAEILRSFSICVSRALPEVVRALRVSVPLSTLELSLVRLIQTLRFVEALPPFGTKEWRVLTVLLLDSLSIQRLPRLGVYFSNNRLMMRKVLDSTGTSEAEYDVFRDVVLPLGRSPTFSTLSGG